MLVYQRVCDRNQIAVGVLCVGIEFPCLILAPADAVLGWKEAQLQLRKMNRPHGNWGSSCTIQS